MSLSRRLCLKPAIAVICGVIIFTWVVHWDGSSARMKEMFWEVGYMWLSVATGVDIYCTSESQILRLGSITQIRILTGKMSSEQLSNMSAILFWPTEKKSITIHCATNGYKLLLLLYFVLKMLILTTSALWD